MKAPFIVRKDREIMKAFPNSIYAASCKLDIAKKRFGRDFERTELHKLIARMFKWMDSLLKYKTN
jgi:hypothetical protein